MPALLSSPRVRPLTASEYLFLGDLLSLLEEPVEPTTGRWILAVVDRVLTLRLQGEDDDAGTLGRLPSSETTAELVEKLQRLRDRIALRAPYQLLANEVRCELRSLFAELRVR
jgi:hypothetical protein